MMVFSAALAGGRSSSPALAAAAPASKVLRVVCIVKPPMVRRSYTVGG
jgi:hypothetical protein